MKRSHFLLPAVFTSILAAAPNPAWLSYDGAAPPVRFAAAEIRNALESKGTIVSEMPTGEPRDQPNGFWIACGDSAIARVRARFAVAAPKQTGPQSYAIRKHSAAGGITYLVLAADPAGAMYGGLELAESIRIGALDNTADSDSAPFIERRGIKFNIPLDARTPTYSDNSDAAQQNIPEMWSFDFWRDFIDDMARHRYNVLTLWSLHPFPSLVRVPEYPDVALEDVKRTTLPMDDTFSHTGNDMVRPAMLDHLETVRKMTIGEKIAFWRDVMQYAQDRGVEVYLFTWNIFTFGAAGKDGITQSQTNPVTINYFRKSVRETVLTYPLLAGIGITSGEQMENRKDDFSKEKWLWKTYGEGIRDALKLQPERKFRLIHRYHQTAQSEILEEFKEYPGQLDLSFKYAIAHMYSTPKPPFIAPALPHLSPKLRSWLTVRNDDIYSFRWADPAFARAFIRNIPGPDKVAGFYMGPDGYIWGREYLSVHPLQPAEPVIRKQWASFLLWGRLSYDPELPDSRFRQILAAHFPGASSDLLADTWAQASRVFPEITSFHWGDIDLRWFPEACLSHPKHRGFFTVRNFIEGSTMPESGNLNILTWRERMRTGQPMQGKTPLEVAAALQSYADAAMKGLARIPRGQDRELLQTLGDIEAMAQLGYYYAEKIRGAADLALYDQSGKAEQKESAIRHLQAASAYWKSYAAVYSRQYKPQLLNRVGYVDIPALQAKVDADIAIALNWVEGTIKDDRNRFRGADTPFKP